ncbi:MAG: ThiF family adenylyltransferase [Planctomycetota bacterium]|jgi:molybdopterin/thiamine biosynthesis adenylyltransferase
MKLYIIGAGGTASYLLPVLVRTLTPDQRVNIQEVILIDRDMLEPKNVDRQLYSYDDVGKPKAEVLAEELREFTHVPITAVCEWFTAQTNIMPESFVISCTDNHPARLALLTLCDDLDLQAVICGNETFSADAYYYERGFKDTKLDPRVRYPEILTDRSDDPTRPPCNDANALADNPQLAAANMMSAAMGMHLVQLWLFELDKYDLSEVMKHMPVEYSSCTTNIQTVKHKHLTNED